VKRCLGCDRQFSAATWTCASCGTGPEIRDGIPIFLRFSDGDAAGDAAYLIPEIQAAEARHFWFRQRLRLVQWAMRTYFSDARRALDVGCGTGFVLGGLRHSFPALSLVGCDRRIETIVAAREAVAGVEFFVADTTSLPFASEFDVVTVLDVLEHIDDDADALCALRAVLKPGGGLIITVPQHPRLWSDIDDFSCHRRRYTRADLTAKVRQAGFTVVRSTSFFSVTLPLLIASRALRRRRQLDPVAEFRLPTAVNSALAALVAGERWLIERGLAWPVGGSLLLIARRPDASP
jgi:SAM-dependent methyltransferase